MNEKATNPLHTQRINSNFKLIASDLVQHIRLKKIIKFYASFPSFSRSSELPKLKVNEEITSGNRAHTFNQPYEAASINSGYRSAILALFAFLMILCVCMVHRKPDRLTTFALVDLAIRLGAFLRLRTTYNCISKWLLLDPDSACLWQRRQNPGMT